MKSKYRLPIYIIAILLLAIVIADTIWWFYITSQYDTFPEMVTASLKPFPEVLQNARWLTALEIWLLAIALFIFMQAIKVNYLKVLSVILAALSGLLCFWRIFSLM